MSAKNIFNDNDNYCYWRDKKIAKANTKLDNCFVEIKNPLLLSASERTQIQIQITNNNFVLYRFNKQKYAIERAILAINQQLGLLDYDRHLYSKNNGLAYISTNNNDIKQQEFIPYSNKALNWHTDGYYNPPWQRIRSFNLFCVEQADKGGENAWIDHEIVYILLREQDAKLTKALSNNAIMIVPEHRVNNKIRRQRSSGAVFFIDEKTKQLMLRYTQRKQNIIWADDAQVINAKMALDKLLSTTNAYHFFYKLQAGEGLVCHNIIHKRSAFSEINIQTKRLMLRGRYFNRINVAID